MRLLLSIMIFAFTGNAFAQTTIPFKFTSEDDNRLIKENDTCKIYEATGDSLNRVWINEETSYYRLVTKDKDKKVMAEGAFAVDGEKNYQEGKWTEYYATGGIKTTGYYRKGKPVGTWEEYFDNGKLKIISNYGIFTDKDGTHYSCLSGSYQKYYKNGQMRVKGFYSAKMTTVNDTLIVEDPITEKKTKQYIPRTDLKSQKAGHWDHYTEAGEVDKKEDF